jgi:hypothetical protein
MTHENVLAQFTYLNYLAQQQAGGLTDAQFEIKTVSSTGNVTGLK